MHIKIYSDVHVPYVHIFAYAVVPTLGDPCRERPPAMYGHVLMSR